MEQDQKNLAKTKQTLLRPKNTRLWPKKTRPRTTAKIGQDKKNLAGPKITAETKKTRPRTKKKCAKPKKNMPRPKKKLSMTEKTRPK